MAFDTVGCVEGNATFHMGGCKAGELEGAFRGGGDAGGDCPQDGTPSKNPRIMIKVSTAFRFMRCSLGLIESGGFLFGVELFRIFSLS